MKFAAIDPGTRALGFCILDWNNRKLKPIDMGTIRPKSKVIHLRLTEIQAAVDNLFQKHKPKEVAVEKAYFGRNAASALRLGEGRGVVLASAGRAGAKLFEYTATEAKQAVTANGRAAKSSVQQSVQAIFGLKKLPESDAADAAAIAVCHAIQELGW